MTTPSDSRSISPAVGTSGTRHLPYQAQLLHDSHTRGGRTLAPLTALRRVSI